MEGGKTTTLAFCSLLGKKVMKGGEKMKKIWVALSLSLVSMMMVIPVIAKPSQPTWGTFLNSGDVPEGSILVLNIVQKIENSVDSGIVGYWALISYTRTIQVWETPEGDFYAIDSDNGKWYTFEGALSPFSGTEQTKDSSGTFHGGYVMMITGTFNPDPGFKTRGSIGTTNYGGTQGFIELGTYGAQGDPVLPGYFNWIETYFDGWDYNYVAWGWTYNYRGQTWNNYDYGNSGDIVV